MTCYTYFVCTCNHVPLHLLESRVLNNLHIGQINVTIIKYISQSFFFFFTIVHPLHALYEAFCMHTFYTLLILS